MGKNKLCDIRDFQNISKKKFLSFDINNTTVNFLDQINDMLKYTFRCIDIKQINKLAKEKYGHFHILQLLLNDIGYEFVLHKHIIKDMDSDYDFDDNKSDKYDSNNKLIRKTQDIDVYSIKKIEK